MKWIVTIFFVLACAATGLFFLDSKPFVGVFTSKMILPLVSPGLKHRKELPANKWVEIYRGRSFIRQAHAGIAYDSKRHNLIIFGSNTHGYDWDNSVHVFDPVDGIWRSYYPPAPKETYRTDESGNAICGNKKILPWAMHTFDNILYDSLTDSLVVTAVPAHNSIGKTIKGPKIHPTWIYQLETHQWRIFVNSSNKKSPKFFAAASSYDSDRDVITAYRKGIWELGPDRDEWIKATKESHHGIHYNMEYDSKHKVFAVFGNSRYTNDVWIYKPGDVLGEKGEWEKKIPGGDTCPKDEHFPVAFDTHNGVFLIVPDNRKFKKDNSEKTKSIPPESASTFVYDYEENKYIKIVGADLPPQKMNYMMVYDAWNKVFLLVTGDYKRPLVVMAFRLDMEKLN
ncbi:hypothetical protein [Desulfospira joergensenii]|uniref:hypothetical protein n=1 Tax=Desulfospira joergensenii TaxID=53329 RepID=UPI0003B649E0|nr:hypothetical protein [Desulfospira joergensenii]